jgi:Ca-activated chloride channel family protein
MIEFGNPYYLYLLVILPVLVFLYLKNSHKQVRIFSKLGDKELVDKIVDSPQPFIRFFKTLLLTLAVISLVIALADPLVPGKQQSAAGTAKTQIVFALDVSKSMLARDVLPSRLGRAQSFILSALDNLNNNEQVAIVIFAGQADTYVPLTTDHNFIKNAIKSISNNLVLKQGTSIKRALKISSSVLNNKATEVRMICLMSDGETPETNLETYTDTIRKTGINVLALGLGTQTGSDIIENSDGNEIIKNDKSGRPIISHLHEENLLKIVKNKSTDYFKLDDKASAIAFFTNHVKNFQQNTKTWIAVKKDYFQLFLLIALFLLAAEALIP